MVVGSVTLCSVPAALGWPIRATGREGRGGRRALAAGIKHEPATPMTGCCSQSFSVISVRTPLTGQKHEWLLQLALDDLALGSLRGSTLAHLANKFPIANSSYHAVKPC